MGTRPVMSLNSKLQPHTYLLEVGCEELPPSFLLSVESALTALVQKALQEKNIGFESISVEHTPRRIVVLVAGLPESTAASIAETKGPPLKLALDAMGTLTPVGQGFLKKNNAVLADCETLTLGGEAYWLLKKTVAGQSVKSLIASLVLGCVMSLQGARFMRWAHNTQTFPRPIRWLVSLWNDELLPVSLALGAESVVAGAVTQGHRVLGQASITVSGIAHYLKTLLEQGKVILSVEERKQLIIAQLNQQATAFGGSVVIDPELLDYVSVIVEAPSVVVGSFDAGFLAIPRPVLITVMKAHQRYFPLVDLVSGELLPNFLCVINADPAFSGNMVAGNQRVLNARFQDAKFFFEEDTKEPLIEKLPKLAGVTFQKGLGTLLDKTDRLKQLMPLFQTALGYDVAVLADLETVATLSKADLVTQMVFELTELQGEVGYHYGLKQGLSKAVAIALFEQYLPRFQGDELPQHPTGIALSLADKLDTLVALFSQTKTKLPTGSKDPLGLRRLVNGVLLTILDRQLPLNLKQLCQGVYGVLGSTVQEPWETTWALVETFMLQRLKTIVLQEKSIRFDVVDAVFATVNPLENLTVAVKKAEKLNALVVDATQLEPLNLLVEPAKRIDKMLGSQWIETATVTDVVETDLVNEAEIALFAQTKAVLAGSAPTETLAPVVEAFFEAVMVNDENLAIRQNRYRLLSILHTHYCQQWGKLSLVQG
jgi:glycyl-tRNA synthetase beta chain